MTNPETGKDECVGCGKEWKANSLYCGDCQSHNVGTTESSLAGLVAKVKPGTVTGSDGNPVLGPCFRCKTPNTIVVDSTQAFCQECMREMSYNSYLGRYTST